MVVAGINIFLDGFVPTENLRFRETSLVFKVSETAAEEEIKRMCRYDYGHMVKNLGGWPGGQRRVFTIKIFIRYKFHNYTTSYVRLTSMFRPPSAAFFRNLMFSGHCSLDGVASRLSHT